MMRDICARFKYSERDAASVLAAPPTTPASPAVSTPRSNMTDRERSGSETSLDDDCALAPSTPTAANTNTHTNPTLAAARLHTNPTILANNTNPTMTPTADCPPRELIHRNLRRYHRDLEAGRADLAAVGARVREDLAPYAVLKLGGFSLGNVAPRLLANVLVESSTLRTLDLGFNRINDRGAALLARALEKNASLTSLYLSGNDIGPAGAQALASALETNATLRSLHLSGNNIGEAGAAHLARGLERNRGLRALYIGTNGIGGGAGVASLASMLLVNRDLEELTLGQNKLGSAGLAHLAAAFATGAVRLTTLEVGKNGVEAEGAIALAKALCAPDTPNRLQNLYLDNNPLGDVGAGACGALLAKNATLRVLDLSYTQMSLLGLRDLSTGLSYSASLLCLLLDGHDWASTQYMKKTNGLHGMSLSTKGANNFAASCIAGAVNANVKSALYKLTGVDLALVLATLPLSNEDRALLSGDTDAARGARPLDLVTRNERILRYMQEQRGAVNSNKRKSEDVASSAQQHASLHANAQASSSSALSAAVGAEEEKDASIAPPALQRRRTSSENYQNLTVDTTVPPARPPLRPTVASTPPTSAAGPGLPLAPPSRASLLMRNPLPRHPSWSSERRLSLKSPRYESTMEVQVRKVMGEIAKLPFDAEEYAALQTYYLGGCHGPKTSAASPATAAAAPGAGDAAAPAASPSSSAETLSPAAKTDDDQVPCPACRSSRLAQYPQSMVLKTRMETKPDSDVMLLVLLRQLHYLVGVFQNIDNAEPRIDAILASMHDGAPSQ